MSAERAPDHITSSHVAPHAAGGAASTVVGGAPAERVPPRDGATPEQRQRLLAAQDSLTAASKFLGRLAQLEFATLGEVVQRRHRVMAQSHDAWFDAERAVADAVSDAQRHPEQEVLLVHIAEVFRSAPWYKTRHPSSRVGSTEASGQYVATVALLALLVRDRVPPDAFDLLYAPLAGVIPLGLLERE